MADSGAGRQREPVPPDVPALKQRVLVAAAVTLLLFLVASYVLTELGAAQGWVAVVMALVWVTVTRPLMRPVRDASRLRRRLAYQAWLDQRDQNGPDQGDPR